MIEFKKNSMKLIKKYLNELIKCNVSNQIGTTFVS